MTTVKQSQDRKTPDELLEIAVEIWTKVKEEDIPTDSEKECETLYKELLFEYRDFMSTFPLVVKWMVFMRKFRKSSFKKFIEYNIRHPVKSEEDFTNNQAEYAVLIFEADNREHRSFTYQDVYAYRAQTRKMLKEEFDMLKHAGEQADEEIKVKEAQNKKQLIQDLMDKAIAAKQERLASQ
jgi:hypothetical protein